MANESRSNLLPFLAALIILGLTGWYGYNQFLELEEVKAQEELADSVLFDVEQESRDVSSDYNDAKKDFFTTVTENKEKIEMIFPQDEDLTNLTRNFDEFAFQNHYSSNPFFISQLSYNDISEEGDYRVLPITMTIETSEKNFDKFLEYIENSGSLENGVQLVSVNAITLQISEDADGAMRVQLSLYAYLQNS